jgi:hypothetical protein
MVSLIASLSCSLPNSKRSHRRSEIWTSISVSVCSICSILFSRTLHWKSSAAYVTISNRPSSDIRHHFQTSTITIPIHAEHLSNWFSQRWWLEFNRTFSSSSCWSVDRWTHSPSVWILSILVKRPFLSTTPYSLQSRNGRSLFWSHSLHCSLASFRFWPAIINKRFFPACMISIDGLQSFSRRIRRFVRCFTKENAQATAPRWSNTVTRCGPYTAVFPLKYGHKPSTWFTSRIQCFTAVSALYSSSWAPTDCTFSMERKMILEERFAWIFE